MDKREVEINKAFMRLIGELEDELEFVYNNRTDDDRYDQDACDDLVARIQTLQTEWAEAKRAL